MNGADKRCGLIGFFKKIVRAFFLKIIKIRSPSPINREESDKQGVMPLNCQFEPDQIMEQERKKNTPVCRC
jgi:hypothetical protein